MDTLELQFRVAGTDAADIERKAHQKAVDFFGPTARYRLDYEIQAVPASENPGLETLYTANVCAITHTTPQSEFASRQALPFAEGP
jgi:hypothetical protein